MNVTLLENVEIGEEALIAAGSVVVPHTKIPPRVLAAGSPAKVKKAHRRGLTLDQDGLFDLCELCRSYLAGDYKSSPRKPAVPIHEISQQAGA